MSLDVYLTKIVTERKTVFESSITHNLGAMAREAGIYEALWRPEEIFTEPKASDIIPLLEEGLKKLKADPERFKLFDSSNGYGVYDDFVPFLEEYLQACKENPDADIRADR